MSSDPNVAGPSRSAYGPELAMIRDIVIVTPGNSDSSESSQKPVKVSTYTRYMRGADGPRFHGLSRRQLRTLLVLAITDFVGAVLLTNQNPWYPIMANEKGLSATQYGFVFGVFELTVFLFSPIFQNQMRKDSITPNTLFHVGVFTAATASIFFSFLSYVSSSSLFLGLSITLRIIEGLGEAAFIAASFAIIAVEFPETVASTFVSLETFFGLGILIGPPVGGALWDALPSPERFTLTFGTFGAFMFLAAIFGLFVLPRNDSGLEDKGFIAGFRSFSVLNVSCVPLSAFTVLSAAISAGFLFVTLSPHLMQFTMVPALFGGIFLLNGGIAALSSPGFAWLIEKLQCPKLFITLGASLIMAGFLFIGPASYIPIETSPWLTCVGLIIHGLGLGAVFSSTFKFILSQAVEYGYANNTATYTIVSSIWTSMFCLGTFLGTAGGGILYDWLGFRSSAWVVIGLQGLVILFTLLSVFTAWLGSQASSPSPRRMNSDSETKPLLPTNSSFSFVHQKAQPLKKVSSEPNVSLDSRHSPTYGAIPPTAAPGSESD